jgi:hypothetical protein
VLCLTVRNWYHRISDAVDKVSHKLMLLLAGSIAFCWGFVTVCNFDTCLRNCAVLHPVRR